MSSSKQSNIVGNELANQTSPYLLQHAENPVHWKPWGDAALAEAKQRNVPILLSVGYAACHWCHVMAHECFEDEEVAAAMNAGFVNVKVDREERPDVDTLYMAALHALGEQGGWPLTMFINSDGAPIWGGTYFPKHGKYGRPGFLDVMAAVHKTWTEDPDRIAHNTSALLGHLHAQNAKNSTGQVLPDTTPFIEGLLDIQDITNGGTSGAPKFPNAPMAETLWNAATLDGNKEAEEAFLKTLTALSTGGIYDHIGGGLARYSVDDRWLVPHFEKMLYDNAHFVRHLTWGWRLTGSELFRIRIEETVEWLKREMLTEKGAFSSSLDADSEGVEGKFYVWQHGEVLQILGDQAEAFCLFYDIRPGGNWEGNSIPNLLTQPTGDLAKRVAEFSGEREKLLKARSARVRPSLDDKVLTDWNAMMIEALTEAGYHLERPDWIDLAKTAFHFCSESSRKDKKLIHSRRNDEEGADAFATDYAQMINAALTLYEVSGDELYLSNAKTWAEIVSNHYAGESGEVFLTSNQASDLPVRTLAHSDEANPSGASVFLRGLSRLYHSTGELQFSERAETLALALTGYFQDARHGQAGFFAALPWHTQSMTLVLVGDELSLKPWIETLHHVPRPARQLIKVTSLGDLPQGHSAKAARLETTPAALICQKQTCSLPITNQSEFRQAIKPT